MILTISTIAMLVFFAVIGYIERKCGQRSKDFFDEMDPVLDDLEAKATQKYRDQFGRDPTGTLYKSPYISKEKKP